MPDALGQRVSRELFLVATGVPLEQFDPWVIDRLTASLEERAVRAGDVLFGPARPLDHVYFMQHGRVRLTREGAPPWTFEGRWLLGAFDVHRDGPPARTATALTDLHALRIRKSAFLELLEDSFFLTRNSVTNAATTVARLEERVGTIEPPVEPARRSVPPAGRELDAIERLVFLMQQPAFRGPGVQVLAQLAAESRDVQLAAGEALALHGSGEERLFLVVDGEIRASRRAPDVTRLCVSGDLVPGAAALARACHEWEARAAGPARVLSIPVEAWYDVMEDHFELARSALAALSARREVLLDVLAERQGPEGIVFT